MYIYSAVYWLRHPRWGFFLHCYISAPHALCIVFSPLYSLSWYLFMDSESTMTNHSGSSGMTNSQSLPIFYNPNAIMAHTHLTKENHVNWSTLFKTLLWAHQLLFVIDPNPPSKTLSDGKENPDHHKWKNVADLICCWIKGTVTPAI